jgi:methyl-accepting chemotaxis protein
MRRLGRVGSLTLRAKVGILVALAVIAAVAPATLALWLAARFKHTMATIHTETIVPLENLHRVEQFLREVELRIPGVQADWFSGPGAKAYVNAALPQVRKLWDEFRSRPATGPTAALVSDFDAAFQRFLALTPRLEVALRAEDKKALEALADEWLDLKPMLFKPLVALVDAARDEVGREVAAAEQRLQRATRLIVIGLAILLGVFLPVAVALHRGISIPLRTTVRLLRDLAKGEGDLTTRLDAGRRDEVGEMSRWFNTFMDKLHDIVGEAKRTAVDLAAASQQLAAATERLSATSQEQASSLEEAAASLEEMTGTVRQNADSAGQASQLAAGSQETAQAGGRVVTSAVASMEDLTRASQRIVEITSVIDEIAFQTNLLALNAAVEAARAGDQGRGFAVVAAEVRGLAQRSAIAAKEIKGLIQDSVTRVEGGAALVRRSGQTLEEIIGSVKRVTAVIAEMAAASQEQSQGIAQVSRAVAQMDSTVQETAGQAEELTWTSQTLADQARQLEALVGRFRLADGPPAPESPAPGQPVPPVAAPASSARPRVPVPTLPGGTAGRRLATANGSRFERS